jgi:hypothetical protein
MHNEPQSLLATMDANTKFMLPKLSGLNSAKNSDLAHMDMSYVASTRLLKMANKISTQRLVRNNGHGVTGQQDLGEGPRFPPSPRSKSTLMNFKAFGGRQQSIGHY